ncbi:MAG: LysR family transcriptional regulator [Hyphomicrobiaceae bacterium]|nr:LysR family transcriptional regulator [Hyphomicrobiaceae bacterium]
MTAISDLEIFARVARTANMSAAGREMGLSPAVVSKRISLLEERLGARLFQRTTRHLTLTETGEGYFKRVVDILSLIEEAEDFVNRRNTRPRGVLKVTAPTAFSRLHIAPFLPDFLARYADVELEMHLTDNIVDIIRDGFDVAIRIGELRDSSLVARKLAPDHRVLCAAPSYLASAGMPKTLADLESHNCLLAGAQDMWRLEGPDGQTQVRVKGNIRSNSADFVRQGLLAGLGIGLRSTWDIGAELKSGALEVVLPNYRSVSAVSIFAVYPCREFMPNKVTVFIEFLAELYGRNGYWERAAGSPLRSAAGDDAAPNAAAFEAAAADVPAPVAAAKSRVSGRKSGNNRAGRETA